MKAATTSLYTYLKQHPDIFMTNVKEPMFFNNLNKKKDYILKGSKRKKITSFDEYYSLFKEVTTEKAIGEASPAYIYDKDCPELIKKYLPNTKIIAILRQPTERAYSNYLHVKRSGRETIDNFEDAFKAEELREKENWSPLYYYKSKGLYFQQLSRYYQIFPKKNIKIILFRDLINDPQNITKEVMKFLNIDSSFSPNTTNKANMSGIPKGLFGWLLMKFRYYNLIPNIEFNKYLPNFILNIIFSLVYSKPQKIDAKLCKKLTEKHYREDILKLEKLTDKNLQHWLF